MKAKLTEIQNFQRGQDTRKALDIGSLRNLKPPTDIYSLELPFQYKYGEIQDRLGNSIIKANRNNEETPLMPFERDELLKFVTKLINWAYGFPINETYFFKRSGDTKKEVNLGVLRNLPDLSNHWRFPVKLGPGFRDMINTWNQMDAGIIDNSGFKVMSFDLRTDRENKIEFAKAVVDLLNWVYAGIPIEPVKESVEFKRNQTTKKALKLGDIYKEEIEKILEEDIENWIWNIVRSWDEDYLGEHSDFDYNWNYRTGIISVYFYDDEGDVVEEFEVPIDQVKKEIKDMNFESPTPDQYTMESMEFKRGQNTKRALKVGRPYQKEIDKIPDEDIEEWIESPAFYGGYETDYKWNYQTGILTIYWYEDKDEEIIADKYEISIDELKKEIANYKEALKMGNNMPPEEFTTESLDFKRNQTTKKALGLGEMYREKIESLDPQLFQGWLETMFMEQLEDENLEPVIEWNYNTGYMNLFFEDEDGLKRMAETIHVDDLQKEISKFQYEEEDERWSRE